MVIKRGFDAWILILLPELIVFFLPSVSILAILIYVKPINDRKKRSIFVDKTGT